jgi:hypothetical protein
VLGCVVCHHAIRPHHQLALRALHNVVVADCPVLLAQPREELGVGRAAIRLASLLICVEDWGA